MKYFYTLRNLVLAACVGMAGIATAQTSHPLSFGMATSSASSNNFYKDYVGLRFQVSAPAAIAGDKSYTAAYDITDSGATGNWGGAPVDMIDSPVKFGPVSDTNGCAAYPAGYFNGKIAIVWRGTCEFGFKALQAQNAGAIACVIVNNATGGPVGMAAGASGGSVTIPVYMISLNDGQDITSVLNTGGVAKMTIILNWGIGNNNDLGFVPGSYSTSTNFAMPLTQLMAASHPAAYKNINGAYIANFGLHNATNVQLQSDLTFTPTGGSPSSLYKDTVRLASFPTVDSIYTFFGPEYNVPTVTNTGKFDLKYTIASDSSDAFLGDNTYTHTFYATDSLYSKGRYDFSLNKPVSTYYTRPGITDPYIWGVPYYIANGGSVIKTAQFSVSNGPGVLPAGQQMYVYVFKWVDATSGTNHDSVMQNSELELVGAGIKTFDGTLDSSFQSFTVAIGDTINGDAGTQVFLDANSWYLIAPEVPGSWALGLDGVVNGYPRTYGRNHFHSYFEMYNPLWPGDRSSSTNNQMAFPNDILSPIAFPSISSYDVDSVVYSSQRHLLPSVPFTVTTHPNAVGTVKAPFAKINMYPNPATDNINVSVSLEATAPTLTYTIIDGHGKFVSREIHQNVQNEVYNYNTSNLASGNYYILVSSGDKFTSKKFTVVR